MTETKSYICIRYVAVSRCLKAAVKRAVMVALCFVYSAACSRVVLSEIMFDPAGPEQSDEYVEIMNLSETEVVDLKGWKISDGDGEDTITDAGEGLILCPHQYGIILDADYFEQSRGDYDIPDEALVLTIDGSTLGSGGLSNSRSETVSIINSSGLVVCQYAYATGNRSGYSDEKIDLELSDDPENWSDSRIFNGTPGYRNSVELYNTDLSIGQLYLNPVDSNNEREVELGLTVLNNGKLSVYGFEVYIFTDNNDDSTWQVSETIHTLYIEETLSAGDSLELAWTWPEVIPGQIPLGACVYHPDDENRNNNCLVQTVVTGYQSNTVVINEIMPDPAAGQTEWVEIFNTQDDEINLKGWAVSDQDTANPVPVSEDRRMLAPESYAVLSTDSSLLRFYSFQEIQLIVCDLPALNNNGDEVVLYDPAKNKTDRVRFQSSAGYGNGISLERIDPYRASDDASNWHASVDVEGGTPGFKNSVFSDHKVNRTILNVSPNPFSPDGDGYDDVIVISYQLPSAAFFSNLRIFDLQGRCIRTLAGAQPSGFHNILTWDGNDDQGRLARVGIYIVHLEAESGENGEMIESKTTLVLARRF